MEDFKLYESAIDKYGEENQLNQAIEECAEFIVAVNKLRRGSYSEDLSKSLASEVADVIIMMNQVAIILGNQYVNEALDFKKSRLRERLRLRTHQREDLDKQIAELEAKEAIEHAKSIHGDNYTYELKKGTKIDLSTLNSNQRICASGVKGHHILMTENNGSNQL